MIDLQALGEKPLARKAYEWGKQMHRGQTRKFSGEPYFNHCRRVASKIATHFTDEWVIAVALLHDAVEDTSLSITEVHIAFNDRIANGVGSLTKSKSITDTNCRIAQAEVAVQAIKCADILDNAQDIVQGATDNDKIDWARGWIEKKQKQLKAFPPNRGAAQPAMIAFETLWDEADDMLAASLNQLAAHDLSLHEDLAEKRRQEVERVRKAEAEFAALLEEVAQDQVIERDRSRFVAVAMF